MAGHLHQLRAPVSLLGPGRPRQEGGLAPGQGEADLRGQRPGGVRRAGRAGLSLAGDVWCVPVLPVVKLRSNIILSPVSLSSRGGAPHLPCPLYSTK